jgi:hypothetical protein
MGLTYYGFALFIFMLLCIFALLCKHLFMHNKGHIQNLDEKEKKLLTFYSTMEDMMDEFNQTALAANEEMNRHIAAMRNVKSAAYQAPAPPAARSAAFTAPPAPTLPPLTRPPAPPVEDMRSATAGLFDASALSAYGLLNGAAKENSPASRPARILALHEQGLDRVHIAKQLSVTLSEVDLVLGLAMQRK